MPSFPTQIVGSPGINRWTWFVTSLVWICGGIYGFYMLAHGYVFTVPLSDELRENLVMRFVARILEGRLAWFLWSCLGIAAGGFMLWRIVFVEHLLFH